MSDEVKDMKKEQTQAGSSEQPDTCMHKVKPVNEKEVKIEDLTNMIQRIQADFENYKKRVEREKQDMKKNASKDVVMKLLPIVDNFELAIKNKSSPEEYIKGTELIFAQLIETLENIGVEIMQTQNQKFDPRFHEALLRVESEKTTDTIVEELQKGYMLNNQVLRYAKVKVAK